MLKVLSAVRRSVQNFLRRAGLFGASPTETAIQAPLATVPAHAPTAPPSTGEFRHTQLRDDASLEPSAASGSAHALALADIGVDFEPAVESRDSASEIGPNAGATWREPRAEARAADAESARLQTEAQPPAPPTAAPTTSLFELEPLQLSTLAALLPAESLLSPLSPADAIALESVELDLDSAPPAEPSRATQAAPAESSLSLSLNPPSERAETDVAMAPAAAPMLLEPPSLPSAASPATEPLPGTTSSSPPSKRARAAIANAADSAEAEQASRNAVAAASAVLPLPARLLGPGERCVWRDEFDYEGLPSAALWSFQTDANRWIHSPSHNELQWYTEGRLENAQVSHGTLKIKTVREPSPYEGCAFTSARLRTKGKGDWLYGRLEVCAKLPAAKRGLWPAIWLVSSSNAYGSWPGSGEIDMVENLGCEPGLLHGSVHTGAFNHRLRNHQKATTKRADAHTAFHVYGLDWTPDSVALSVDGQRFFEFRNRRKGSAEWPFDHPFHLILNVAVGGNWGGKDGIADDVCPAEMEVAYVRVFQ